MGRAEPRSNGRMAWRGCCSSLPSCASGTSRAPGVAQALAPLEQAAVARLKDWLPKLTRPIRIGEHDQTAFSFGLILDWRSRPVIRRWRRSSTNGFARTT